MSSAGTGAATRATPSATGVVSPRVGSSPAAGSRANAAPMVRSVVPHVRAHARTTASCALSGARKACRSARPARKCLRGWPWELVVSSSTSVLLRRGGARAGSSPEARGDIRHADALPFPQLRSPDQAVAIPSMSVRMDQRIEYSARRYDPDESGSSFFDDWRIASKCFPTMIMAPPSDVRSVRLASHAARPSSDSRMPGDGRAPGWVPVTSTTRTRHGQSSVLSTGGRSQIRDRFECARTESNRQPTDSKSRPG